MKQRLKSKYLFFYIAIICLCILQSICLRLSQSISRPNIDHKQQSPNNQQQQLNYLIGLQNNLVQGTNSLSTQIQSTRSKLASTTRPEERISILQNAIQSQRAKIGDLSNKIIPDPNSGYYQCYILSADKQNSWKVKASQISARIKQIEQLNSEIPQCDETRAIKAQISKARAKLDVFQRTISNQCQKNLEKAQTVYQTNLYQNNNWILGGSMTMDQLIDEYYQRSLKYANISNCPLDRPFLASTNPTSSDSSCIACKDKNLPYFDMLTKSCINCKSQEQSYDVKTRKCVYLPRNSDYNVGKNYRLKPLTELPAPNPNLKNCPAQLPFYDLTRCVQCKLPNKFWQPSQSKCLTCPDGSVFSLNVRQCVNPLKNILTDLDDKKWVTNDGNITRIYEQRHQILQANKTSGVYQQCQSSAPYFDNIVCVNCPQGQYFNIDQARCVLPPADKVFSLNQRKFVKRETNLQMDPKTPNYISSQQLNDDPNIPNCNSSYPYYDQISCVLCQKPFTIFNYDTKQCTNCDQKTYYEQGSRKCVDRPIIYVNGSKTGLLATQKVSINDYDANLKKQASKNPLALLQTCPDQKQYAAITKCITCNPGQYFNIQSYTCQICDGTIDQKSSLCKQQIYYLVNTDASNLLVPQNTNLQQIKANNNKLLTSQPKKYAICNIADPYPSASKTVCGDCSDSAPLYNIQSLTCIACQTSKSYDPNIKRCRVVKFLTDYNKNVIITPPTTMQDLLNAQAQVNKTEFTRKCPQGTPYTSDGSSCFACSNADEPYFDIKLNKCSGCPKQTSYSIQKKQCVPTYYMTDLSAPNLLQQQNYTIANLKKQQQEVKKNPNMRIVQCNSTNPFAISSEYCRNCTDPKNSLFNLKTKTCSSCPTQTYYQLQSRLCKTFIYITNFTSVNSKIVQKQAGQFQKFRKQQEQRKKLGQWKECPENAPYVMNNGCAQCNQPSSFFIADTRNCGVCDNYIKATNSCPAKPTRYPNLTNYFWITSQGSADNMVANALNLKKVATGPMCPEFYNQNTKDCVSCNSGEYFSYVNSVCEKCPAGTIFDPNIHQCAIQRVINTTYTNTTSSKDKSFLYGAFTFNQLQSHIDITKKNYPDSKECPASAPYFDDIKCISCPNYKKYFNLRYKVCQVCLTGETLKDNDCYRDNAKVFAQPTMDDIYKTLFNK